MWAQTHAAGMRRFQMGLASPADRRERNDIGKAGKLCRRKDGSGRISRRPTNLVVRGHDGKDRTEYRNEGTLDA
ncbi:hypothetical protein [Sphingobacterium sp.]|uniref:hypothetical protein n=1 Tax=Sphingobacterium sp. TaxID=341027 RepID=UPI002FDCF209